MQSNWMKRVVRLVAAAAVTLAAASTAWGDDSRRWVDATGRFSINARFAEFVAGSVTLIAEDGRRLAVPLSQLSSTDQAFVRNTLRAGGARRRTPLEVAKGRSPKPGLPESRPISNVAGIQWYTPEEACRLATSASLEKPVLWFRVLGDMEGFM